MGALFGLKFRPAWRITIVTVVLFAGFVALGFWQVDRAYQKTQLRDEVLSRAALTPIVIGAVLLDVNAANYRAAMASGVYMAEYQLLLDNQVYRGQAGYHVLTPMRIPGSQTLLLVNRGWVSWGADRQHIPEINTPLDELTVKGRLVKPVENPYSLDTTLDQNELGKVWQSVDLERFRRLTGMPVHGLVMQLDSESPHDPSLTRVWPQYEDTWIQRHYGYAVQWFGLAITLIVIFVVVNTKRRIRE